MKIFHCCETLKGGIATHLNNLVRLQLREYANAEIYVLCPAHHAEYVDAPGVNVVTFTHRGRNPLAMAILWWQWALLVWRHQPDLIHLHSTFAGLIGRTIPHAARIVYCAHGWSFETNASPLKKRAYQLVERMLAARADEIIVISRSELDAAVVAGIDGGKCTIVYNGITERPATPPAKPAGEAISVLFVGRLDEQKGYDVLLDAFHQLDGDKLRLDLVGEAVQSDSAPLDLPRNVSAHGWLSHDRLDALMAASDVLVVPSRWEGFGMVAIEAMREGKPSWPMMSAAWAKSSPTVRPACCSPRSMRRRSRTSSQARQAAAERHGQGLAPPLRDHVHRPRNVCRDRSHLSPGAPGQHVRPRRLREGRRRMRH